MSCILLYSSLACKTLEKLISVMFLFSSCSVSRDPFGLMVVQCGDQAVSCRQWTVKSPTAQELMCYPNNCISPSYYASPYCLSKFVSLRFFASRNSCMGAVVLFVHAISTEHKVFKMCDKWSRYYVVTHPSPRCQTSSKPSQQPQRDHSWSRSPVQQGHCTHCNFSWNFSQI